MNDRVVADEQIEAARAAISLVALAFAGAPGPTSPAILEIEAQNMITEVLADSRRARQVIRLLARWARDGCAAIGEQEGLPGPHILALIALLVDPDAA